MYSQADSPTYFTPLPDLGHSSGPSPASARPPAGRPPPPHWRGDDAKPEGGDGTSGRSDASSCGDSCGASSPGENAAVGLEDGGAAADAASPQRERERGPSMVAGAVVVARVGSLPAVGKGGAGQAGGDGAGKGVPLISSLSSNGATALLTAAGAALEFAQ